MTLSSPANRFKSVSVIIPTLGEPILKQTVEHLLAAEAPLAVEVIIAGLDPDNLVSGNPAVTFAETPRKYIPADARNFGAARASGELFLFLDSDAFVEPDFFHCLLEAMSESREVVHGAMNFVDDTAPNLGDNVATFHGMHISAEACVMEHNVAAYCLAVTREVFEKMEGFNEGIFMAEDWEFANRVRAAGYFIYFDPILRITHHSDRHTGERVASHARSYAIGNANMLMAGDRLGSKMRVDWFGYIPPLAAFWSAVQATVHTAKVFRRYPAMRTYKRCARYVWLFYYSRRRHLFRILAGKAPASPGLPAPTEPSATQAT